ncbi:MAG: single-stranded-DNA-specific exonuclease RecJ [bacterium]|nr:single-stranded-DNA-specific exonuclease RecJ [bacterium]
MRFILRDCPPDWKDLSNSLGILPPIAKILVGRGISSPFLAKRFLSPFIEGIADPFLLPDVEIAISRVKKALVNRERVCLYGDYDVDGLTSIATLFHTMKGLGFDVFYYIPNRLTEGYGLNIEAIEKIRKQNASLIITLDCGVSSFSSIEYASSIGIDTIVIDHHNVTESLPKAIAIVDPKREDSLYPFRQLSGVGVAWQFARALVKSLLDEDSYLEETLDLVSLGTIADIVPLTEENRIIVKRGINRLKFSPRIGLLSLMRSSGIEDSMLSAELLSLTLVPRLNSAGRLGSVDVAIELLLTSDPVRAKVLSGQLEEKNRSRRGLVDKILEEIIRRLEGKTLGSTILEYSDSWHSGVLGIVASRLVDMFNRPAFVGKKEGDIVRFSVRSPEEVDIYSVLFPLKSMFLKFGGHHYALGLTIKEDEVDNLKNILDSSVHIEGEELVEIDADLPLREINPILLNQLSLLEPFGMGNPRPIFIARGVRIVGREMQSNSKSIIIEEEGKRFEVFDLDESTIMDNCIDLVYSIKGIGKIVGIGGLKGGNS